MDTCRAVKFARNGTPALRYPRLAIMTAMIAGLSATSITGQALGVRPTSGWRRSVKSIGLESIVATVALGLDSVLVVGGGRDTVAVILDGNGRVVRALRAADPAGREPIRAAGLRGDSIWIEQWPGGRGWILSRNDLRGRPFVLATPPDSAFVAVQGSLSTRLLGFSATGSPIIEATSAHVAGAPRIVVTTMDATPGATTIAVAPGAPECLLADFLIPNCDVPLLAVSTDGERIAIAAVRTRDPDSLDIAIRVVSAEGATTAMHTLAYPADRLTPTEVKEARARLLGSSFVRRDSVRLAAVESGYHPVRRAVLSRMLVGTDGTVWLQLPSATATERYAVFGPEHDLVTYVEVAERIALTAVGSERLWATATLDGRPMAVIQLRR